MRTFATLGVLLALACPVLAAGYQDLGVREKETVDEALALRGLTLDPQPQGKIIGTVHVVNLDVFTERDLPISILGQDLSLAIFNRFHWTTREEMIRREALFHGGQVYDQDLIDETARALTNPVYTSALGIVPVKAAAPGVVDILIATRDIWTLRLNTNFEFQAGSLIYLTASLAENSLFGHRKQLALVTELDQGRLAVGPTYVDPNIRGTRLTATAAARLYWARDTGNLEGSSSRLTFAYPLYSLDSRWSAGIDYGHSDAVIRQFDGSSLYQVQFVDPNDPMMKPVTSRDYKYRLREVSGTATIARRLRGPNLVHDLRLGHLFDWTERSLLADFPADPLQPLKISQLQFKDCNVSSTDTVSQQFKTCIFPPSGYVSALNFTYSLFAPRYRIYRDLDTFDLRENAQLGPSGAVVIQRADRLLGTDIARQFWLLGFSGTWAFDLADGYQWVSLGWSGRHYDQQGRWSDQNFTGSVYAATPVIRRALRIVGSLSTSIYIDDSLNHVATMGGDSGLRGYAVGEFRGFQGGSSFIGHVEVRSMAVPVLFMRAGVLAFYDAGDAATPVTGDGNNIQRAWDTLLGLHAYQDVGVGLRVLIPQANTYVLRADWAFALEDNNNMSSPVRTRAGWPGRFSAGFAQVF